MASGPGRVGTATCRRTGMRPGQFHERNACEKGYFGRTDLLRLQMDGEAGPPVKGEASYRSKGTGAGAASS